MASRWQADRQTDGQTERENGPKRETYRACPIADNQDADLGHARQFFSPRATDCVSARWDAVSTPETGCMVGLELVNRWIRGGAGRARWAQRADERSGRVDRGRGLMSRGWKTVSGSKKHNRNKQHDATDDRGRRWETAPPGTGTSKAQEEQSPRGAVDRLWTQHSCSQVETPSAGAKVSASRAPAEVRLDIPRADAEATQTERHRAHLPRPLWKQATTARDSTPPTGPWRATFRVVSGLSSFSRLPPAFRENARVSR